LIALLRKRLSSKPPASYSFAASEVLRLCGFTLDRAQVRRWAIENNLAHATAAPPALAPVRRWQRSQIGELWQLDASPHRYLPHSPIQWPMLNMRDDCSRVFTGAKLYERELLLAYFDFLPPAFLEYGLPLQLYVDDHSLFFTSTPDALTQLGAALHFYGISLRYAPTPQAKGKVEREHQFWQKRLPASGLLTRSKDAGPGLGGDRDVAQTSKSAVSQGFQPAPAVTPARDANGQDLADWEIGDTAGSETCATRAAVLPRWRRFPAPDLES
jgi:hypothetical protein